jgi:hypothetical protein
VRLIDTVALIAQAAYAAVLIAAAVVAVVKLASSGRDEHHPWR